MQHRSIAYHDYAVLLAFLDESANFRLIDREGRHPVFRRTSAAFTTACCAYRDQLQKNCQDFAFVNHLPEEQARIAPYLYNPICFMTFGHADCAALVLLDDFDPLVAITMDIATPVEQVFLGFCPKLDSLDLPVQHERWFVDLHELIASDSLASAHQIRQPIRISSSQQGSASYQAAMHGFQYEQPLQVLTNYKLNGIASLGEGLALQRALYRAVAARTAEVLESLREQLDGVGATNLFSEKDIDACRCVLFEPQGAADLITLLCCTNYTVALAVVTGIRQLTMGDLIQFAPDLPGALAKHPGHDSLYRMCRQWGWSPAPDQHGNQHAFWLPKNHVFSTTYTTVGAAFNAYEQPDDFPQINGGIEVDVDVDISCGHRGEVQRKFLLSMDSLIQQIPADQLQWEVGFRGSCYYFGIGRHDFLYSPPLHLFPTERQGPAGTTDRVPKPAPPRWERTYAIPTATYLKAIRHLIDTFRTPDPGRAESPLPVETGLLGITSALSVPVPKLISGGKPLVPVKIPEDHAPLVSVLLNLRDVLFLNSGEPLLAPGLMRAASPHTSSNPSSAWPRFSASLFDLVVLDRMMRRLGVPRPLRRTLGYLFQDFATCLSDPDLFPAVLDLYDLFSGIYHLLTSVLPGQQAHAPAHQRRFFFHEGFVDDLAGLVQALQNSMKHRIAPNHPNSEIRDMDVELRGGLNKLMAAIHVPLKCGFQLLQRLATLEHDQQIPPEMLGGVIRLTSHPRTICGRTRFNDPHNGQHLPLPCLAYVEMNVATVFSPEQYVNLFHEICHLIWGVVVPANEQSLVPQTAAINASSRESFEVNGRNARTSSTGREQAQQRFQPASEQSVYAFIDRKVRQTRIEELFVNFLTHLFIFKTDAELFVRHHLADYGIHPFSNADPITQTRIRFAEVALRAFLVYEMIDAKRWHEGPEIIHWSQETSFRRDTSTATAFGRFCDFLDRFGKYFAQWEYFSQQDRSFHMYLWLSFSQVYPDSHARAARECARSIRFYQDYLRSLPLPETTGATDHERVEALRRLEQTVREAMECGEAEIRWRLKERATFDDNVLLLCQVLNVYLGHCFQDVPAGKEFHFSRDFAGDDFTGSMQYHPDRRWHTYLLDAPSGALRCSVPGERRQRLTRAVVLLKTLWDISTGLRTQSLEALVGSALRLCEKIEHGGQGAEGLE